MVDQLTIDSYILKCWRAGDDTYTIARDLKVREYVIANRLWHIMAKPQPSQNTTT